MGEQPYRYHEAEDEPITASSPEKPDSLSEDIDKLIGELERACEVWHELLQRPATTRSAEYAQGAAYDRRDAAKDALRAAFVSLSHDRDPHEGGTGRRQGAARLAVRHAQRSRDRGETVAGVGDARVRLVAWDSRRRLPCSH